jgi:hypothetical protein
MKCPVCSVENPDGKEFCGDCGAPLPEPVAPATVEAPAPTPTPATPAAAAPAPTPAPQYQPPAAAQPVAAPAASTKFKLTAPIALILAGVILLGLIGCGVGAFLIFKKPAKTVITEDPTKIVVKEEPGRGEIVIRKEKGFGTAMEALADLAEQFYKGADWYSVIVSEEDARVEYYITPDETTYDKGVVIELKDVGWLVTDTYTVDMSKIQIKEEPPKKDDEYPPEVWAAYAVDQLLTALKEGRYDDALAMTTQPLSDTDLTQIPTNWTNIEYVGSNAQEDGNYIVIFTITWEGGTDESAGAIVMPTTDQGWLISQLGSYTAP